MGATLGNGYMRLFVSTGCSRCYTMERPPFIPFTFFSSHDPSSSPADPPLSRQHTLHPLHSFTFFISSRSLASRDRLIMFPPFLRTLSSASRLRLAAGVFGAVTAAVGAA